MAATSARTPHLPAGPRGDGPTIEFARSNLAVPWCADYGSLLELAEACDVPVRWSCRTGVCQTCETTLIAGELDYNPDPVEPPPDGSALICCSTHATILCSICERGDAPGALVRGSLDARPQFGLAIGGTGGRFRYQNPLQIPANGCHGGLSVYQRRSGKSGLSHGLSWPTENRGVLGSIPSLAISKDACT
jgi:ferredoxin